MNPRQHPLRVLMIGTGGMARSHLQRMLEFFPLTTIPVVCEPSEFQYGATVALFERLGRTPPANEPDLERLLATYGAQLDVAVIITPHVYHFDQAAACLEAGLDVLLEKPMVMTAQEARDLIAVRDRTGRLLVVAFQGSLSPEVRQADILLRTGAIGTLRTVDAAVWQNWRTNTVGTWRQQPELSGGGFLFDTGAHMLNTVSDLAAEPFVEVAAYLDNLDAPVDILGAVIARLQSGVLVTLNACGDAFESCHSEVRMVGTRGMLRTGVWGKFLDIKFRGEEPWAPVPVPPTEGVWEQFLNVRLGLMANPSPPEVGLRMAGLWDAIRESAAHGGRPVRPGAAAPASVG